MLLPLGVCQVAPLQRKSTRTTQDKARGVGREEEPASVHRLPRNGQALGAYTAWEEAHTEPITLRPSEVTACGTWQVSPPALVGGSVDLAGGGEHQAPASGQVNLPRDPVCPF